MNYLTVLFIALNDYSAQSCILRLFPRKRKEIEELLTNGNRQREKTFSQKMRESDHLLVIERERAKVRQGTRNDIVPTLAPSEGGKSRDIVADKVGMSHGTFDKARTIWDKAKDGDEQAERHERRPPWPSRGKSPWC